MKKYFLIYPHCDGFETQVICSRGRGTAPLKRTITPGAFFRDVYEATLASQCAVAVIPDLLSWVTAMDGWSELETNHRSGFGVQLTDRDKLPIMGDPPTFLRISRGGTAKVTVIDLRNWLPTYVANSNVNESCATAAVDSINGSIHSLKEYVDGLEDYITLPSLGYETLKPLLRNAARPSMLPSWFNGCLHGGLVGCNYMGTVAGKVYLWDRSSAYLDTLRRTPMPLGRPLFFKPEESEGDKYSCAAKVTVKTDKAFYPIKVRDGDSGIVRTVWPIGSFHTYLCGTELALAVSSGDAVVGDEYVWFDSSMALSAWADAALSTIKQCPDKHARSALKSCWLGAIGCLASIDRQWELVGDALSGPSVGDWWTSGDDKGPARMRNYLGKTYKETVRERKEESSPAVFAWLTAAARMELCAVISHLQEHAVYWDTDSVMVDAAGHEWMCKYLADGKMPGNWRFVQSYDELRITGYRSYVADGKLSCPGIPADATPVTGRKFSWSAPPTWNESMGLRSHPDGVCRTRTVTFSSRYNHGTVTEDGRVLPPLFTC